MLKLQKKAPFFRRFSLLRKSEEEAIQNMNEKNSSLAVLKGVGGILYFWLYNIFKG